mmetsp:Transcript_770/g.2078  ORF Transcript_770/g.2078 Transcript_770/m.2078 type:complete len:271 (-) Transcript_770:1519-2331(-)
MDMPMMLRNMARLMSGATRPKGFRSMSVILGGSVASASAPIESMIMFTQRSGTAPSGNGTPAHADTKLRVTATTLTTSWNCKNLRMLWYTFRPHSTAFAMDWMLSSRITMSHASFAISVPASPSAKPTSASFSAGASLVPSPVTETTSPRALCCRTRISLSVGDERASTRISSATARFSSGDIFRNVGPSISAFGPSDPSKIPASCAINFAVSGLSPVTMRTMTPACLSMSTASRVSGRMGSLMPSTPTKVISDSGASSQSRFDACGTSR